MVLKGLLSMVLRDLLSMVLRGSGAGEAEEDAPAPRETLEGSFLRHGVLLFEGLVDH